MQLDADAFADDPGPGSDPEADARFAALAPDDGALIAIEVEGLLVQAIAKGMTFGQTRSGFLDNAAMLWDVQARRRAVLARALARQKAPSDPPKPAG